MFPNVEKQKWSECRKKTAINNNTKLVKSISTTKSMDNIKFMKCQKKSPSAWNIVGSLSVWLTVYQMFLKWWKSAIWLKMIAKIAALDHRQFVRRLCRSFWITIRTISHKQIQIAQWLEKQFNASLFWFQTNGFDRVWFFSISAPFLEILKKKKPLGEYWCNSSEFN